MKMKAKIIKISFKLVLASTMLLNTGCNSEMSVEDEKKTLVIESVEESGNNCTYGGIRIDSGLDTNSDDLLSSNEITQTTYECNEAIEDQQSDDTNDTNTTDNEESEENTEVTYTEDVNTTEETNEDTNTTSDSNTTQTEETNTTDEIDTDCSVINPSYSYTLVDTDQTECYDSVNGEKISCSGSGQDGEFLTNTPTYTSCSNDEVVVDNHTGLMWEASSDTDGVEVIDIDDKLTLDEAHNYCSNLSLGGFDDWRLPSIKEMYSIYLMSGEDISGLSGAISNGTSVDYSAYQPFIDTNYFDVGYGDTENGERVIDGQYATSTLSVSQVMLGVDAFFGVNFVDGHVKAYETQVTFISRAQYYVRCTRGNSEYGTNDFSIVDDDVAIDNATNIMWQRDDNNASNYQDALDICNASITGGYSDWRLPNVKELQSIVDYTKSPEYSDSPAIDTDVFRSTEFINEAGELDWGAYWSSTALMGVSGKGDKGAYITFGRALGYVDGVVDAHGAGAQRSDYKTTQQRDRDNVTVFSVSEDATFGSTAYRKGPQGDLIRVEHNFVRCMRDN